MESNQEDGDAVVTGVASPSSPPVEHSDDQQPSTVEPEQTAQPLTEGKSETAEVDVTESLRIVQKHPMHIIPTPTNVLKSAAEEKLEHQLSDVEKASSSPDRKEGNESPLLPVEEKAMLSSVNVDVMQASPEGQTPPSISVKQRESRDSPKKGRRDKKSSESAKGGEKKSTDVEMTMPDSMLGAVEPQNLPAVHHEPSEEKSPSSSKKKANKNLLELSLESAEASIKVDEMQMLSGAPAKRSGGKEASPTKHHEKKISECVELEEKDSSSLNMEATADPLEAHEFHGMSSEHLKGKGSAIKRKREKEPVGPMQTKEEEFSNIVAGTASSIMEPPVPPNTEAESLQEGQKPPTKKSTDNVEKGKKTKTKLLEASAKQKTSNQQRCSVS
ncbi:unnamed protein product, partial [Hydatigera taeniaeformis]